ncbi:hypothetical protein AN1V17_01220 [Vallitalea sediminicola]
MKKLLVTIRHPGPADAILTIIPKLNEVFSITMIVTDCAIDILKQRFPRYLKEYTIYFPGKSIEGKFSKEIETSHFKTEFDSSEKNEYENFYKMVLELVDYINPDVALRTTPAYKWGIDEIIPRAMKEIGKYDNSFCFQEYYGVGKGMNNYENEVAIYKAKNLFTVDRSSAKFLHKRGIEAISVGWISHIKFQKMELFQSLRKKSREKIGIKDEKFIMYCVVNCGEIIQEVNHFEKLLICLEEISQNEDNIKILIKFHPRNSKEEIKLYKKRAQKYNVQVVDVGISLDYYEILTLPDIIYSAASNMNIDLLAYQYAHEKYEDIAKHVMSVYSNDNFTKHIIHKATGNHIIPSHTDKGGHVLVNDENMKSVFKKLILDEDKYEAVSRTAYDNFNGAHCSDENIISSILKLMR